MAARITQLRKLDAAGVIEKRAQAERMGLSMVQLERVRRAARAQGVDLTALPPGRRVESHRGRVPTQVVVRLPAKLARQLRAYCVSERRSLNAVAVEAVSLLLNRRR
jgi:hypothetical protein